MLREFEETPMTDVKTIRGFAGEILDTVTVEPLREWLEQRTVLALPGFQRVEVKA